jgi:hypothetical protein
MRMMFRENIARVRGKGGRCIPVPVVLLRLVVLGRVLGFCRHCQQLLTEPLRHHVRTGHGDGCVCRVAEVVVS